MTEFIAFMVGVVVGLAMVLIPDRQDYYSAEARSPNVRKAERDRKDRWEQLYCYFLTLGYDQDTARYKADAKMRVDAEAAEKL